MRLQLSDGTIINTDSNAPGYQNINAGKIPSKRQVKNKKGGLKRINSQRWIASVGGYRNDNDAIAAPTEAPLCKVREEMGKRPNYTDNLGGSTYTGYRGGRGA